MSLLAVISKARSFRLSLSRDLLDKVRKEMGEGKSSRAHLVVALENEAGRLGLSWERYTELLEKAVVKRDRGGDLSAKEQDMLTTFEAILRILCLNLS